MSGKFGLSETVMRRADRRFPSAQHGHGQDQMSQVEISINPTSIHLLMRDSGEKRISKVESIWRPVLPKERSAVVTIEGTGGGSVCRH